MELRATDNRAHGGKGLVAVSACVVEGGWGVGGRKGVEPGAL